MRHTRHGSLTVALAETLLAHLRDGLFREPACQLVGIATRTLARWMALGRQELEDIAEHEERTGERRKPGKHGQLVIDVLAAEARVEAKMTGVVTRIAWAGNDDALALRAAQWYLERKRNLIYGRGALRTDLPREDEAYSGETEEADSLELLATLSRYAALRNRTPPEQ